MTRINCIPVEELTRQHLIAEYRELPRLYNLSWEAYDRGERPADHGDAYTLGAGHVRFFYSRMGYIRKRHKQLIAEMKRRGYQPLHTPQTIAPWPRSWQRNWEPTPEAIAINRARLIERDSSYATQ